MHANRLQENAWTDDKKCHIQENNAQAFMTQFTGIELNILF